MIAQRSWIQKKKNLIATMKLKPAFDNSLEAKAVKFLESMCMGGQESADAFLSNFGQTSDASLTDFIQSIVVLVSSSNQVITTAAMEMLVTMIVHCSAKVRLSIIKADLIPQLILTLNPLSLSFTEAVDIRIPLLNIISSSLWLSTPFGLAYLGIQAVKEPKAVYETNPARTKDHRDRPRLRRRNTPKQALQIEEANDTIAEGMYSPFLNWNEERLKSEDERALIFWSLVATVKFQPALDASLVTKAVKYLNSMYWAGRESADAFLSSLRQTSDNSLTEFIQSIGVLISSPSQIITTTAMEMLVNVIGKSSAEVLLPLITADVIPQVILTLNPLSLSITEAVDIHTCLIQIIRYSILLPTPNALRQLEIEEDDEQHAHETVLKRVLTPSEKYICHLCVNRHSIIDGDQSYYFLDLLARILRISPYYLPTMDFLLNLPVFLTIPSCLTFFDNNESIWYFLEDMNNVQWEWTKKGGDQRLMWQTVHRMLREEGIEDVFEHQLLNTLESLWDETVVTCATGWNNMQAMNI
ncbi:hypothetical protein BLNAU_21864 [Blattamonas nauphoetae]|uniref:Uncharacterized protein n=1 Tax=Blattamonas nauphoetae TaxID=2049346 RepID=A0ABQ9WUR2_9EUKA|nr:hypothetical protein BLNAU_21864 [Blattamonas nauphoetae]